MLYAPGKSLFGLADHVQLLVQLQQVFLVVAVDGTGHVTAATAVAKADITGLGIPDTNTTYEWSYYFYNMDVTSEDLTDMILDTYNFYFESLKK